MTNTTDQYYSNRDASAILADLLGVDLPRPAWLALHQALDRLKAQPIESSAPIIHKLIAEFEAAGVCLKSHEWLALDEVAEWLARAADAQAA